MTTLSNLFEAVKNYSYGVNFSRLATPGLLALPILPYCPSRVATNEIKKSEKVPFKLPKSD